MATHKGMDMAREIQDATEYMRLKWLADKNTWVDEFILMARVGTVTIDAWDAACWIDTAFNPAGYRITEVGRTALACYEAAQAQPIEPMLNVMLNPAQVDDFLFGKDVDVKQLQAHELHDVEDVALDDKDARIQQLEAIIAAGQQALLKEAHKAERYEALLREAAQVIAPVKDAVDYDADLMKADDASMLYCLNSDGDEHVIIETEADFLRVRELRAIAEFASKLAALDKPAK